MRKKYIKLLYVTFLVLFVVFAQDKVFAQVGCSIEITICSNPCEATITVGDYTCEGSPTTVEFSDMDCDGISEECPTLPDGCTPGYINSLCDNCPEVSNPGQEDSDGDNFADACDYCSGSGRFDMDEDGLCDEEDNCYGVPNPDQKDSDGDGFGDVCTNNVPMFTRSAAFSGSYEEIGRQIAIMFPDTILYAYGVFPVVLGAYDVTPEMIQNYYAEIENIIPDSIKAHMRGLALGLMEVRPFSYATAWEIVVTNSLFINALKLPEIDAVSDYDPGCTAFAVSSEEGTFLAHNTDNQKGNENMGAIMYIEPDNGDNSYLHMYTAAFPDVALGYNDKGLAVTFNVGNPNVNPAMGLPALFMLRHVMEKASTLDEVIDYFNGLIDSGNYYGPAGTIFLVVDFKDSSMAKIQVRSEKIKVTYGQELKPGVTYVASTNHYDDDFRDDPTYYYESSWKRLERLQELLQTFDTYDLDTCWAILGDHGDGEPNNNTISRNGSQTGTTVSNIFTADGMYYTNGMPHLYLETYGNPQYVAAPKENDTDNDSDDDGVLNDYDECEDTPAGVIIDPSNGCSIEQLIPCEGPRESRKSWKNHGKYVSASTKVLKSFVRQGLITKKEIKAFMKEKASSDCGR